MDKFKNYREQMFVDPAIVKKWSNAIEGKGAWEEYSSMCPKVPKNQKAMLAQLFENIEIAENIKSKSMIKEGTDASAIGNYSPILIPMLRRGIPAQIGPRIFGTQPMSGPTGLIFALRSYLSNDSVNTISYAGSVILFVADVTGYTVGGPITQSGTNGTATGVVRFIEDNKLLVEVVSGTFGAGTNDSESGIDNADPFAAATTYVMNVFANEASTTRAFFKNYTGPVLTGVGEKLGQDMKEVGVNIETAEVKANTRNLKANWTNELEEDLANVHNISAEQLLTSVANTEIEKEMNREFLDLAYSKSGGSYTWDFNTSTGRWDKEKFDTLCTAITRSRSSLSKISDRGPATFAIVSDDVAAVLSACGNLDTKNIDPINNTYAGDAFGMAIYVDMWKEDNSVFLGYKGAEEIDAGIFYAPYIGIQIRKGYGEDNGQPRTIFRTRYGLADNIYGAENYYRTLNVLNLPAIGV